MGEAYEPHDTALHATVLKKHADLEETITRVTTMRREVPAKIVADYEPAVIEEVALPLEDEKHMQGPIDIARLEEVIANYEKSIIKMKEMKGSVNTISAKLQRAKEVLSLIEAQQQQPS